MWPRIPVAHFALSTGATLFVLLCLIVIQDSGRGSLNPLTGRFLGVLSGTTTDPRSVWSGYDQSSSMEKRVFHLRGKSSKETVTLAIPRAYLGMIGRDDDGRLVSINISVASDNLEPWKIRRFKPMPDGTPHVPEYSIVVHARLVEDAEGLRQRLGNFVNMDERAMRRCIVSDGPLPDSVLYTLRPGRGNTVGACIKSMYRDPADAFTVVTNKDGAPHDLFACRGHNNCKAGSFIGNVFFRFNVTPHQFHEFQSEIERVRTLIKSFQVNEVS